MTGDSIGVSPDLINFSILLRSYCAADRVDMALDLRGSIIMNGLQPDEVILNNLLEG